MVKRKPTLTEFEPSRAGILTAPEICNIDYKPIEWIVQDTIPLEGVTVIVSPPKVGKSILALNIAIESSVSDKVLGYFKPCSKFDILYIDLEGTTRRSKSRIMKMLGNNPIPPALSIAYEWPRLHEGGLSKLYDYATYHPKTKLFIIDTLGRIQKKSKTQADLGYSYKKDIEEIEIISTFCKTMGVAVILLHHTKKAESDDWVGMVSGTHGLSGSVDTLLYLQRRRGEFQGKLSVTGRDVEDRQFRINADMKRQRIKIIGVETEENIELTDAQRDIVMCLETEGEPMSPSEIADGIGKSVGSVKRLLANMIEDGKVIRVGYGKYCDRLR
jgi:hypothetical protein